MWNISLVAHLIFPLNFWLTWNVHPMFLSNCQPCLVNCKCLLPPFFCNVALWVTKRSLEKKPFLRQENLHLQTLLCCEKDPKKSGKKTLLKLSPRPLVEFSWNVFIPFSNSWVARTMWSCWKQPASMDSKRFASVGITTYLEKGRIPSSSAVKEAFPSPSPLPGGSIGPMGCPNHHP